MPSFGPVTLGRLVRHRYVVLVLLGALLFVPFLGTRTLWYPDEPDLAEITLAMVTSGDWILPTFNGAPFVNYPPLLYWAGGISSFLPGGMSEFNLRLPLALAGILVVLATALAASRWFGPEAGLWGGLLLLTFHKFALQAVTFRPDALFTVAIAGGMLLYAAGAGDRRSLALRAGGFVLLGLAMLAKGPLGLLLPGLVLLLWHLSRREWGRALGLAPLSLVALAVYLPWFIACARAMGADNILYELWAQNVARFAGAARGHGQPFHYFVTFFWFNLWPWSWLFPVAAVWIWKSPLRKDRNVQLLFWWLGTFLVFLSAAVTKRHVYLLPAYPAVALLMAPWIARWTSPAGSGETRSGRTALRVWVVGLVVASALLGALVIVLAVGGPSLVERVRPDPKALEVASLVRLPLAVLGSALVALACVIGFAWRGRNGGRAIVAVAMTHWALYALLQGVLMPAFEPVKTFRPQSEWLRSQVEPGIPLATVHDNKHSGRRRAGFAFYMRTPVRELDTRAEIDEFFERFPGSLVLVESAVWDSVAPEDGSWDRRVVRELRVVDYTYRVIRGPLPGT